MAAFWQIDRLRGKLRNFRREIRFSTILIRGLWQLFRAPFRNSVLAVLSSGFFFLSLPAGSATNYNIRVRWNSYSCLILGCRIQFARRFVCVQSVSWVVFVKRSYIACSTSKTRKRMSYKHKFMSTLLKLREKVRNESLGRQTDQLRFS